MTDVSDTGRYFLLEIGLIKKNIGAIMALLIQCFVLLYSTFYFLVSNFFSRPSYFIGLYNQILSSI